VSSKQKKPNSINELGFDKLVTGVGFDEYSQTLAVYHPQGALRLQVSLTLISHAIH